MTAPSNSRPSRSRSLAWIVAGLAIIAGGLLARRPPPDPLAAIERGVRTGTATPDEVVRLGEEYLRRGQPLKAAEMAFRARKADPDLPGAHHLLGTLHAAGGDAAKARASFAEAVRLAPGTIGYRLSFARFEIEQRNVQASLEQAQAAVDVDRDSAEAWLLAGKVQRLNRSDGSAPASFRRAIRLDPGLAEAHYELGVLSLDFDNYSEAVAPLERAYELGMRSPQLLGCLALALTAGPGDDAGAERAERLLEEAGWPEIPPAWFARGLLLQRRREFSGARGEFGKVLRANPRNERAQYAMAMAYRAEGDLAAARRAMARHDELVRQRQRLKRLSQQFAQGRPSPALLREYGIALFQAGSLEDAEAQFRAWAARRPGDAEAARWLDRVRKLLSARGGAS